MNRSVDERALETQVINEHSIQTVREAFVAALQSGEAPRIEAFVSDFSEPAYSTLLEQLVELNMTHELQGSGKSTSETIDYTTYIKRFPLHKELVERAFRRVVMGDEPTKQSSSSRQKETRPLPERVGNYEIRGELGAGGFGVVYRGYDAKLRREVAIKLARSRSESHQHDNDYQNIYDEGSRLAQLDDPRLGPRAFEAGRTDEGMPFVVMQFYEGKNLAERIKAGPIPFEETAATIADLAEALHVVHQRGLVHRDVKPANVLTNGDGLPVLVDFGLALPREEVGTGAAVAGTYLYMSPEQADGRAHVADARSDIFSLGVVMYQMLTHHLPYVSTQTEPLKQEIIHGDPKSGLHVRPDVPVELDRICQTARQRNPSNRYNTAQEMASDLRAYLSPKVEHVQPKPPVPKWPWVTAACVIAILVGLAVNGLWQAPSPQPASIVAPPASLETPSLQFLHVAKDPDTHESVFTDVLVEDVPLNKGSQIAFNASLPAESSGKYLYLMYFPERETPELLWPENLANQAAVSKLRHPEGAQSAIRLTGPRRKMLVVVGARNEPLQAEDVQDLLGKLRFDYSQALKSKPLMEFADRIDPRRSHSRTRAMGEYVQVNATGTINTLFEKELAAVFPVFSGWVFEYGGEEEK